MISSYLEINVKLAVGFDILSEVLLDAYPPQKALAVKVEDLRHLYHQVLELLVDDSLINSNELVDQLLVLEEELD